MTNRRFGPRFTTRGAISWFGALLCLPLAALAADEICTSCGPRVNVNGAFAHHKDRPTVTIEGAPGNAAIFLEDINGANFSVTIAPLPAGKYTLTIGAAETVANAPGERVFDVMAGDKVLAKDFDIVASAGGARKVATITGTVKHEDDAIRGPLTISFIAGKSTAKFNTFDIKNADGVSVVSFSASELADAFTATARREPEVKEPPIWRDPSHSLKDRARDLIRRMSLAEKVAQLKNAAPAITNTAVTQKFPTNTRK